MALNLIHLKATLTSHLSLFQMFLNSNPLILHTNYSILISLTKEDGKYEKASGLQLSKLNLVCFISPSRYNEEVLKG